MKLFPTHTPWGMAYSEIPFWVKACLGIFFVACFLGAFDVFGEANRDLVVASAILFGAPAIIMINWWGISSYMKTKND